MALQVRLTRGGWPARVARAFGGHRRFETTRYVVPRTGHDGIAGALRIAFASDFHAGPSTHPAHLELACAALAASAPDLLLLGGDFACLDAGAMRELAPLLGAIPARFGRFAVLGNHDYWAGPEQVTEALEAVGISVLINRSVRLPPPFDQLWVTGLDDPIAGAPDAGQAFDGAGDHRLLLMHAPSGLVAVGPTAFDVAFAGHTHGGQVALPGGRPILIPEGEFCREYAWGRFEVGRGRTLIVSRGIGYSTIPVRIFCPPELVQTEVRYLAPQAAAARPAPAGTATGHVA
jgi:predicted MPP superfamily phosphohydrolase